MTSDPWTPPVELVDPALLAETLTALSDRLAAQEDLLAALVERLDQDETPAGRWTWRHLNDAQSEALLTELTDWVRWLVERYQVDHTRNQIPPCWAQHPVAVEELTALMVSWKAAYGGPDRPPSDNLIAWHDRWLWPCLTRINERLQVGYPFHCHSRTRRPTPGSQRCWSGTSALARWQSNG